MIENITIIEEKKELAIEYVAKTNLWQLLFLIIIVGVIFSFSFELINDSTEDFRNWTILLVTLSPFLVSPFLKYEKCIFKIDKKFITISHPSKNGKETIQKVFVNEEIEQLLVLKKKSGKSYYYELWIEDTKGKYKKILGKEEGFLGKNKKKVSKILTKMTVFLEKNKTLKTKEIIKEISIPPRQITKEQDTAKLKIQDLREGVLFDFHDENWEVIGQVQYDWKLENTDTLYQIKNQRSQISLLFVAQNIAVYTTWIEERVPQYELMESQLDKISQNLPVKFIFRGSLFLKEHFNVGHEFVSKSKHGVKIKQWKYLSENRKESLRILEHEDKDTFVFWGEKIEEFEFSNILRS
jgi:hypothetical protein